MNSSSSLNIILQLASMALTLGIIPLIKYVFSREIKKLEEADTENKCKIDILAKDVGQKADKSKLDALEKDVNMKIDKLKDEMEDMRSDLPFIYVTREDFIRAMDNVDRSIGNVGQKMDKLYEHLTRKGE